MKRTLIVCALSLACFGGAFAQQPDRHRAIEDAYAEIIAADEALHDAEARREQGVEPLPGERLGIVGSTGAQGSRLDPEYYERQQSLENDVERARARLDEAYRRWNDVR
jgi:hypothetical protein